VEEPERSGRKEEPPLLAEKEQKVAGDDDSDFCDADDETEAFFLVKSFFTSRPQLDSTVGVHHRRGYSSPTPWGGRAATLPRPAGSAWRGSAGVWRARASSPTPWLTRGRRSPSTGRIYAWRRLTVEEELAEELQCTELAAAAPSA
jgi:hypothetical protein